MKVWLKALAHTVLFLIISQVSYAKFDLLQDAIDKRNLESEAITNSVNSESSDLRLRVARGLGQFTDPKTIPALFSLLHDQKDNVVSEAIFSLGQLGWTPALTKEDRDKLIIHLESFLSYYNYKKQNSIRLKMNRTSGKIIPAFLLTPALSKRI